MTEQVRRLVVVHNPDLMPGRTDLAEAQEMVRQHQTEALRRMAARPEHRHLIRLPTLQVLELPTQIPLPIQHRREAEQVPAEVKAMDTELPQVLLMELRPRLVHLLLNQHLNQTHPAQVVPQATVQVPQTARRRVHRIVRDTLTERAIQLLIPMVLPIAFRQATAIPIR